MTRCLPGRLGSQLDLVVGRMAFRAFCSIRCIPYFSFKHRRLPSWYGESIGHYENGDTLVVDTIGFNDKTYVDNYRTPHTTKLHVVERFKLVEGGEALEVDVRVEDPGAFTMAWSARQRYRRDQRPTEVPLHEMVCAKNNGDHFNQDLFPIPQA